MILGAVAVALAAILFTLGVVLIGTGASNATEDPAEFRTNLDAEIPVPGTAEVYLQAKAYDVVAIGNDLVDAGVPSPRGGTGPATRATFPRPTITVTGPEGAVVPVEPQRHVLTYAGDGYDMVSLNAFDIGTAGTYRVEVTGEGSLTAVGVGQANTRNESAVATVLGGGVLTVIAFLFLIPGAALLVIGLVWRSVDRSTHRLGPPDQPPAGYSPTSPPPPPPPPPPL